ncbi:ATP-binding protein, partial [Streptomyces klenkii]
PAGPPARLPVPPQRGLPRPRLPARLRLTPTAAAALEHLHRRAALNAHTITADAARDAAAHQATTELSHLARRITPQVSWPDILLPTTAREHLEMLITRVSHRDDVFTRFGLRRGGGRGHGTAALFAGESGTGKTLAAEVVAAELHMDLYIVNLPSVVSKYIGETEKNLERIFSAAETLRSVLLFDEADSMFAKRGEVKGSNDRHANMQSGYLLQRLESFNGLAILTTNLRSNIDTAFTRRFDEVIEFPSPGPEVRARLWKTFLSEHAPLDMPYETLARAYDLAGGSIRASVETAAFTAILKGRELTLADVLTGIQSEYSKLGRIYAPDPALEEQAKKEGPVREELHSSD